MNELPVDVFDYHLPTERIAQFPLAERDAAKMLFVNANDRSVEHRSVRELTDILPQDTLIIMNNSKVIPARLHMAKQNGAVVEVFLLDPEILGSHSLALQARHLSRWNCLVGGRKILVDSTLHAQFSGGELLAQILHREENRAVIEFQWQSDHSFAELLNELGVTPLPPYMRRKSQSDDKERYQTVYASRDGSVAAPTAGLHLSQRVLQNLESKGIAKTEVTLHVGLGTFEPVKASSFSDHQMHREFASVTRQSLITMIHHLETAISASRILCIGTTSLRTVESLYWLGRSVALNRQVYPDLHVEQWCWQETDPRDEPSPAEALHALLRSMDERNDHELHFSTSLMIAPGYEFRICNTLLTNFHQPRSTLLVLVSAFCGSGLIRNVYDIAMANQYRFLSYGDCCLLWK